MHYLIDGYNLLHRVGILLGQAQPGRLEPARARLMRHLKQHRKNDRTVSIAVIYDAMRSPTQRDSHQDDDGIDIFFTHTSEADDLIEEMLRQVNAPNQVTVVSDDRRLQEAARRNKCRVLACEDYWILAETIPAPKPLEPEREETKPGMLTQDEIARWEKEFSDVDVPPDYEDWFGDAGR